MTDWNWFFSSVAQSIAALVGTLLAFVIARLVNAQADFQRQVRQSESLIVRAERLRDAAGIRYFNWYNSRCMSDLMDEVEKLAEGDTPPKDATEVCSRLHLPRYVSYDVVLTAVSSKLESIASARERKEAEERAVALKRNFGPGGISAHIVPRMPDLSQLSSLRTAQQRDEFNDEQEAIDQLRVDVADCIRAVRLAAAEMRYEAPRSSLVQGTLVAVFALFSFGVIYPLSFLPLPQDWTPTLSLSAFPQILFSLRGFLLSLATLVFGGLVAVLIRLNHRLAHDAAAFARLEVWNSESAYSEHLAAWRENQDRLAPKVA